MPTSSRPLIVRAFIALLAGLALIASGLTTALPAFAADPGTVAGSVVDGDGVALDGVTVDLLSAGDESVIGATATTGVDGSFSVAVDPGDWVLRYAKVGFDTSYNGATTFAAATAITVTAEDGVDLDPVTLTTTPVPPTPTTISGTVKGAGDALLAGVPVTAFASPVDTSAPLGSDVTDVDGAFTITVSTYGPTVLRFDGSAVDYLTQWSGGVSTAAAATPFAVAEGDVVDGRDATLVQPASISGSVTVPTGLSAQDVTVTVTPAADPTGSLGTTTPATDGSWSLAGLAAGSVLVHFDYTGTGSVKDEWWNGVATSAAATPVALTAGEDGSGIDASLDWSTTVSGVVRADGGDPIPGIVVTLWDADAFEPVDSVDTAADGSYQFSDVVPGEYTLSFGPGTASPANAYIAEWWDGRSYNDDFPDTFAVVGGDNLVKNASLARGSVFSGTILGNDGSGPGLAGWTVELLTARGYPVDVTETDADGIYTFGGVANGDYKIRASAPEAGAPGVQSSAYYELATTLGRATIVRASSGAVRSDLDISILTGGAISGDLKFVGGAAAADVYVEAVRVDAPGIAETFTDAAGHYAFDTLSRGTYVLRFSYDGASDTEYFGGAHELRLATQFIVGSSPLVKNATLPAPDGSGDPWDPDPEGTGIITATVTGGGTPLAVDYLLVSTDADLGFVLQGGTGDDSPLEITDLPTGDYKLQVAPSEPGSLYAGTWYGGATEATATTIHVVDGATTDLGTIALALGSTISGRVTAAVGGAPIAGVTVYAVSSDEESDAPIHSALTDASGNYTIGGLTPDSYHLYFSTQGAVGNWLSKWWPNASAESGATTIVVGSGIVHITGKDATLAAGGGIDGVTTPGSFVQVTNAAGEFVGLALSEDDGSYSITALPTGVYTLDVYPILTGGFLPGTRTGVSVTAGAITHNVNITLTAAASISGTVTDNSGHALDGISVTIFEKSGSTYEATITTVTDGLGEYSFDTLAAGQYLVGFLDDQQEAEVSTPAELVAHGGVYWGVQLYDGAQSVSAADAITLATGAARTGVNGVLYKKGTAQPIGNVTLPTITGSAKVGQTLTAVKGTWAPTPTSYAYQWMRDGAEISGATGTTYKLVTADAGARVSVRVTATKSGSLDTAKTSAATAVVTGGVLVPVAPTLFAPTNPTVGDELIVGEDTWGPGTVALAYQWKRDGTAIPLATGTHYVLAPADAGAKITVTVTGTRSGYTTATRTSAATAIVTGPWVAVGVPFVTGTAKVGATLTAHPGTWTPTPTTYSYQWLKNGATISGVTRSTYTLPSSAAGATFTVRVTGNRAGVTPAQSGTSAPTAIVTGGVFTKSYAPTITGSVKVGATLTATIKAWSPATEFRWQWKLDGTVIPGATDRTYLVAASDRGHKLSVVAVSLKPGYSKSLTSASTAAVLGVLTTSVPTITGSTLQAGVKLTAVPGAWGPPGVKLTYRWYRAGAAISGATASTYTTTSSDIGKTITVRVTGTRTGSATAAVSSAPYGPIVARVFVAGAPFITGTNQTGSTLTAHAGTWTPTATYSYQWYSSTNGVTSTAISGATKSTFKIPTSLGGRYLTVKVTARKALYATTSRTAPFVGKIVGGSYQGAIPEDGGRLVSDIGAGVYVTASTTKDCSWYRVANGSLDESSIIASDEGASGQRILQLLGSDYGIVTDGCGPWIPLAQSAATLKTSFSGTGQYAVGVHIQPGLYRTTSNGQSCYWGRLGDFLDPYGVGSSVIDYDYPDAGSVQVRIEAGDAGFESAGCGTWSRIAD